MKQSKKIRRVAAVLAAVAVLCSSTTSLRCADAAVSEGDLDALQQEQQELEQQREKLEQQQEATKAKLDQLRADKSKQQEYKATLDSQMQNVQSQINVLNQQVSTLDTSIQEKTAQLPASSRKSIRPLMKLKSACAQSIRTGEASTLQILLSSQNVMDLANKTYLLRSITEHDIALINGLKEEMQGIAAEKAEIEQNRADLTEAKSTLDQSAPNWGRCRAKRRMFWTALPIRNRVSWRRATRSPWRKRRSAGEKMRPATGSTSGGPIIMRSRSANRRSSNASRRKSSGNSRNRRSKTKRKAKVPHSRWKNPSRNPPRHRL